MIIIPLGILALFVAVIWFATGTVISFDDLMELRFLPGRKRSLSQDQIAEIQAKIAPRGKCLHQGSINKPWTSQLCKCKRYSFAQMYYGVALCECGDAYFDHAPVGASLDQEGGAACAAVNNEVAGS